jgi:Putative RNA methylase family UPF0020
MLHLHDYAFFPYERDLAEREVASLVGGRCSVSDKQFTVSGKWKREHLWRLTYFSYAENGTGRYETLQHRLEKSHMNSVGRNHRRQSTRYSVHGLHEYKGKFNPQVAHALLNVFGVGAGDKVLDPFCGSGTTLLEAAHLGISSCGLDMNPLAVFIANTKLGATLLAPAELRAAVAAIRRSAVRRHIRKVQPNSLRIEYLSRWFTAEMLSEIEWVREHIGRLNAGSRDFLLAIASNILRDYSLQDPGDLRIRRRRSPLPQTPFVEAWSAVCREQIGILEEVQPLLKEREYQSHAQLGDVRRLSEAGHQLCPGPPYDYVITSPPYATALPYIDTQRLSLVWLGLIQPSEIKVLDADVLGSREMRSAQGYWDHALRDNSNKLPVQMVQFCRRLARTISVSDGFRRQAVPALLYRYLAGMRDAFGGLHRLLRRGGRMAWVVGVNQTTLGGELIVINTPELLSMLGEAIGFTAETPIKLQAYQRYGMHQKNSIREESVLLFRR